MEGYSAVTPNIVNKDSPIDSLTLINQKTTTSTTNHTQGAITVSYSSLLRVQSIDFQEYFTWATNTEEDCGSVLVINRAKETCFETAEN